MFINHYKNNLFFSFLQNLFYFLAFKPHIQYTKQNRKQLKKKSHAPVAAFGQQAPRQTEKARTPLVKGDELKTVKRLYATYSRLAQEYYGAGQGADKIKKEKTYENLGEK